MPKLKTLSGEEIVKVLNSFGFRAISQRGSHVKLRRVADGIKQTLTIVVHKELDKGTIYAIYKQALRYVPAKDLSSHFYS